MTSLRIVTYFGGSSLGNWFGALRPRPYQVYRLALKAMYIYKKRKALILNQTYHFLLHQLPRLSIALSPPQVFPKRSTWDKKTWQQSSKITRKANIHLVPSIRHRNLLPRVYMGKHQQHVLPWKCWYADARLKQDDTTNEKHSSAKS